MLETYNTNLFEEHVKCGNFIEIGMVNRCKDFKEFKIYFGKKYNEFFIPFEDKVYTGKAKNIKVQETIAFLYEIEQDKIVLSTYKCNPDKKIKNLSKVLKWTWKDVQVFTEWLRIDFLHF